MWLASEMAAFAHVAELGSFTAAARALEVPKVAVSRAVASLEKRLGSQLLTRTTRRVALTPAGALLQPHCQRVLHEVESVRRRFASPSAPQPLRVLVDAGYGRLLVTPLVPRFLEHFSGIALQVALTDTPPTEPGETWDVLICNAPVPQPALVQTPLGSPPLLLCATPGYLQRHGHPRSPADLNTHTVLRALDTRQAPPALELRRGAEQHQVRLRPALTVNDPALVHSSTAAGLGIGVLPEFLCRQGLAMGKLERVLSDWWVAEPLELAAVHAQSNAGSAAIRQFIEFLLANMAPVLAASDSRPQSAAEQIRSDRYQHRTHPHRPMPRSEPEGG
ncbi:MAG TPA: LysR family transcriptional regulator [Steroidobacteraceae bacterium]|nr:LysR family transcriptional regulator [Steroidobacteraceae bacterium]